MTATPAIVGKHLLVRTEKHLWAFGPQMQSVSEIVRRAIAAFLGMSSSARRELPFAALGRSGRRHTARDAETILPAE